jgi:ferritin-like metal-binding protein YciE
MATKEAVAQLATLPERVSVVETKVDNIEEKLGELKEDVKNLHDCLDRTGESLHLALKDMHEQSCDQHRELAGKISELEKFKTKWMYMIMGGVAVFGFVSGHLSAITNVLK